MLQKDTFLIPGLIDESTLTSIAYSCPLLSLLYMRFSCFFAVLTSSPIYMCQAVEHIW